MQAQALSSANILPFPAIMPRQEQASVTATLLIDETLRVLSADAAGRTALEAENGVRLSLGRLCAGSMMLNARIRDGVAHGLPSGDIHVPAANGSTLIISIIPISAFDNVSAGVRQAVLLLRSERAETDNVALAATECGLTAGETEVLRLIYKGLNTVEVAGVMGIRKTTVRTHLKHIFAKTETSRQSELVHFVATCGE